MTRVNRLTEGVHWISRVFGLIAGACICVMMLTTVADSLMRYVFNRPISGVIELNGSLVVVTTFFSLAIAQHMRDHVRTEVLFRHLPFLAQESLSILFTLFCLAFFILLSIQGYKLAYEAWQGHLYRWGAVKLIEWPFKAAIPIGGFAICLEFIADIWRSVQTLLNAKADRR